MSRASIFEPNVIELTLYNDGVSGEKHPLVINGEDVLGNTSPLDYIARLQKTLNLLKPDLRFDAAYPDWVISDEDPMEVENGIIWSINKMLPANLGGKSILQNPEAGTRETKPRLREDVTLDDGTALRIYGQRFTVFYQFDIFAKSPDEAEELSDWFMFGFMQHFGGLFGSHNTVFRQRTKDKEVNELNQQFQVRSLEYAVTLEQYTAIPADLIDAVKFKVSTNKNK